MLQAASERLTKIKNTIADIAYWIREKYRNNRKKCRGTLLILALFILLTGLIMGSYKSVDSLSQGAPINYTSGTIIDSTIANFGGFLGLNTYYKTIPKINMLFSFDSSANQDGENNFQPIIARVKEGTKLKIQAYAKVQISTNSLKTFIQNYGISVISQGNQGWQIYIKQKIKNVVIQQVATFSFHKISNKILASSINNQLMSYETNTSLYYPFIIRVIGINIQYPQRSFSASNTLGAQLLEQTSLLNQLTTQLNLLNSYISTYQQSTLSYASKKAEIDGTIHNREQAIKIASSNWIKGIQIFNSSVQNSTLLQKYLEIYFNSLYNVTYRIQSLQPFQI